MASKAHSFAGKAVKLLLSAAMLALPLGPFALSDTLAAAFADTAADVQNTEPAADAQDAAPADEEQAWTYEYPLNNRVAINRPLGVTAKMLVPQDGGSKTEPAGGTQSESAQDATYTATLQYETYGVANEYNDLANTTATVEDGFYVVRFNNEVIAESDTQNDGWARPQQTRFKIVISDKEGQECATKEFYLYIEPASRTVNLNTCVAASDIDQPVLSTKSIEATYGCTYSYDPAAPDTARSLPTPTRPNYDFDGWYASYNAATGTYSDKVEEDTLFTGTASTTLYAKWTGKRYEVILIGDSIEGENQGNVEPSRFYVTYGGTYETLANVMGTGTTGENTELRGWTDQRGNSVMPTDKVTDTDPNNRTWDLGLQILYAVWGEARESIDDAQISGVEESYPCMGKPIILDSLTVTLPEVKDKDGQVIRPEKKLVPDLDYTVEYSNNVNVSTSEQKASFTITGAGKFKGSVSGSFEITKGTPYFAVDGQDITSGQSLSYSWNVSGNMQVESKLVTDAANVTYKLEGDTEGASIDEATGNITLTRPVSNLKVIAMACAGSNFDATPEEGASYTLSVCASSLAAGNVKLSATSFTYNGKKKTPSITVKNASGTALVKDVDYSVSYGDNCKKIGTHKVKITGLNGYSGSVSKSFTVVPKACSKLKAKRTGSLKVSGKKYGVYKVKWGKVKGAGGYQVYRTSGSKTAKSSFGSKVTSKSFGWQKGKKVTVKVRAFKKVSGKKYYGSWKTITVKAR